METPTPNPVLLHPTRKGKIARLPRAVREQLNQRLDDGESGPRLLAWLNALPEVQAMLATHFGGSRISQQNLSAWKLGGFPDWLREEGAREWVDRLVEESDDFKPGQGPALLAERVSVTVLMELVKVLRKASDSADLSEHRKGVLGAAHQLARLRWMEQRAIHLQLAQERRDFKKEEANPTPPTPLELAIHLATQALSHETNLPVPSDPAPKQGKTS